MRFMMLMKPHVTDKSGWEPSAEAVEAMMKYNEDLTQVGKLLALDGFQPPSKGAIVRFSGGETSVDDVPLGEETVGGYWIIKADSKEEAIEIAKGCPAQDCAIEVRQIYEMSDFPEDVQEAAGELSTPPAEQASA